MHFSLWSFIRLPVLCTSHRTHHAPSKSNVLYLCLSIYPGWVAVTSLIVLGMGGYVTAHTSDFRGFDTSYGGLSVAVAVITLLSVVPMIVLDLVRPAFVTSWVVVELGWFCEWL